MNFDQLIAQLNARRASIQAQIAELGTEGEGILAAARADNQRALTDQEQARSLEIVGQRGSLREQLATVDTDLAAVNAERAADAAATAAAEQRTVIQQADAGRVISEARTYNVGNDRRGRNFALDVARQFLFNDMQAAERLQRHMQEERVERGGEIQERAAGTGAFTGLVVPQYLVDQFAPLARAGRPFADAARHHDLPDQGMTVYLGKATTGTTSGNQSSENAAVSEQDFDDTLLTIPVRTGAGSQTLSRQSVERGVGVEDTVVEDLIGAYNVNIDSTMLNVSTNGLTNVATAIAYTDASPTAAELYPKLLAGPAAVEAALLAAALGDTIVVMHSRRWYWLQSQLTSTWPLFGQPGAAAQQAGVNYGERYGAGFRGILPSGTPVIVDNNIATNLGAGTNEDEIYFVAQSEAHLWEDPDAPVLIRAEQPAAKNLGVNLVVYGYYAFELTRRAHAQKVGGTGLVTPTF
jgi:hypothetical protein